MYKRCIRTKTMHTPFATHYKKKKKYAVRTCAPHAFFRPGGHVVLAQIAAADQGIHKNKVRDVTL